jgi:hypothetical protein
MTLGMRGRRDPLLGHGWRSLRLEPVADNAKPRGRLANRRVEIKLYVPPR